MIDLNTKYKFFQFLRDRADYHIPLKAHIRFDPHHIPQDELYVQNLDFGEYRTAQDPIKNEVLVLPDNLTVYRRLTLSGVRIFELPKGLTVGDTVDISYTPITTLPPDLKCKTIVASYSDLTIVPPMQYRIDGMYFNYTKKLKQLPDNLTLEDLFLLSSAITTLPKNLTVNSISIAYSGINELPEDLNFREITIDKTREEYFTKKYPHLVNKMKFVS